MKLSVMMSSAIRNSGSLFLFTLIFISINAVGAVFYQNPDNIYSPFYNLGVGESGLWKVFLCVALFSLAVIFLYYLIASFCKALPQKAGNKSHAPEQGVRTFQSSHIHNSQSGKIYAAAISLSVIAIGLVIFGVGVDNIIFREDYLEQNHRWATSIGKALCIFVVFFVGIAYPHAKGYKKLYLVLAFVAFEVLFFSLATRRFLVALLFFVIGKQISEPGVGKKVFEWSAFAIISPLVLYIPLELRGLDQHGFIPYLNYILGFEWLGDIYVAVVVFLNNILFGTPLAYKVGFQEGAIASEVFWMSISPLPGSWIGWYDVADGLRVGPFQPYNGIGELFNHGFFYAALYAVFLAFSLFFFDSIVKKVSHRAVTSLLVKGVAYGGVSLFTITFLQYNLRSSTRFFYYSAFLMLIIYYAQKIKINISR